MPRPPQDRARRWLVDKQTRVVNRLAHVLFTKPRTPGGRLAHHLLATLVPDAPSEHMVDELVDAGIGFSVEELRQYRDQGNGDG